MDQTVLSAPHTPSSPPAPLDLDGLERRPLSSPALARAVVWGLPALGVLVPLAAGLPLFASLMAWCLLLGAALTCYRAVATFTGKALRLLVTARLVLVLVLGALLLVAPGAAWVGLVSALLLWLVADRLLGRRALHELWKLTRKNANP